MQNIFYIFIAIILIKIAINMTRYLRCKHFLNLYQEFIEKKSWKLEENKHEIIDLLITAGIEDSKVPYIEPVGYGYVVNTFASVLDNISIRREDIVDHFLKMLHNAIGVYRKRIFEALNPFYWIETIVFLPRAIFTYLGVSQSNIAIRIAQVVWWLIGGTATLLLTVFKSDIENIVKTFITK